MARKKLKRGPRKGQFSYQVCKRNTLYANSQATVPDKKRGQGKYSSKLLVRGPNKTKYRYKISKCKTNYAGAVANIPKPKPKPKAKPRPKPKAKPKPRPKAKPKKKPRKKRLNINEYDPSMIAPEDGDRDDEKVGEVPATKRKRKRKKVPKRLSRGEQNRRDDAVAKDRMEVNIASKKPESGASLFWGMPDSSSLIKLKKRADKMTDKQYVAMLQKGAVGRKPWKKPAKKGKKPKPKPKRKPAKKPKKVGGVFMVAVKSKRKRK